MSRLLAIDYGKKRTGLAVTDTLQIIAQPLETVDTVRLMDYLSAYFQREEVERVVIGLPKTVRNEASETMPAIEQFVRQFKNRFPAREIVYFDERFTSVLAHQAMIDGGMRKKQRQQKAVVDRIAACIILEGYLESIR